MERAVELGRVAVFDRGEGARRVLRAIRVLDRAGRDVVGVAVHGPRERLARWVREADEAVELHGTIEDALRAARADTAWLGAAPAPERAAFAEACERLGVAHAGPSAEVLRSLSGGDALRRIAADLVVGIRTVGEADPRAHLLEVVVARDRHGTARALGVGDASVRAAGVTVLAECPSPILSPEEEELAADLGVRACAALGWVGVGAVQLLFDPRRKSLALAGVDAFAQSGVAVEAAIGLSLSRLRLLIAAGEPLDVEPPSKRLYAVAARLLAAEPGADPSRSPGRVELLRLPSSPHAIAYAAAEEGDEAPAIVDGALATIAVHGETRAEAMVRLEQVLTDADVLVRGSVSSKAWLLGLCARPEIRSGEAGLGIAAGLTGPLYEPKREAALLAAALETYEEELDLERARFLAEARRGRPRVGPSAGRSIELDHAGRRHRLEVRQTGTGEYRVATAGNAPVDVRVERLGRLERRVSWQRRRHRVLSVVDGLRHLVEVDGIPHVIDRHPAGIVASPMPAVVVAVPVAPGQVVMAGEPVARIESMKVEMLVPAPVAGIVREVVAAVNGQVDAGAPLVRLEPLGEATPVAPEPIALSSAPAAEPAAPRDRWLAALAELRRLLLGFDVAPAEAKRLAAGARDLAAGAPAADPEVLRAEEGALRAFADLQSLFSRSRRSPAGAERPPPLEELWRYLHEPEARGAGLTPGFLELLARALSHYGVSIDAPGRALELALLRIQKAHERIDEQLPPVLVLLERRVAGEGPPPGLSARDARQLLDALAHLGQERYPALADLAREVRYRAFDQPVLERAREEAYAKVEPDLARLASAEGSERDAIVERLVASPHRLATLLVSRMASSPPALRPRLVETLLRRYHRARPLGPVTASDAEGLPCAWADEEHEGAAVRLVACFARAAEVGDAAARLARVVAAARPAREVALELYLWQEREPPPEAEAVETFRAALAAAGFTRPVLRASVVVAMAGRGMGRHTSQQHFTFRGGPGQFTEDRRYRGVHPMLFHRMQLGRFAKFDLERLPSVEDVYLYRGVAQGNPKDERLFAVAEVRALAPVRDAAGRVIHLPHLERMLHEALAGMRRFQARRAPGQRLAWNRVLLTVGPPLPLSPDEVRALAERIAPATEGLGIEMVLIDAELPDPATGQLTSTLLRVVASDPDGVSILWDEPTDRPLEPMGEYEQRVVSLRRRGLTHPFEIVRMLAPPADAQSEVPRGEFEEHDLDATGALVPVQRPPGSNAANMVVGVVRNFTERHPEGMQRVVLLGDPSRAMGSLAEPECRRIEAALELAARLQVPLEWFAVSAGAKISKESGTENMDWISRVLRRIVEFTQGGGEINVVVTGINVGAQPYWNAEATMLMHTRGILVMTPGSAMVLTGKEALEYSGSVSAEDNQGIGGYDRIMGPNGQAQYQAGGVGEAIQILLRHYDHTWVAPGERFPRRAATTDPRDRDVRAYPHGPAGGAGFATIGDVFSKEKNPDRKKPFDIRRVMAACIDQDHPPLERWKDLRGGETAVVWDAHLGGWPVCLLGIESRPLPRLEFVPADGPELWSAGTLFPNSSKKLARAVNGASGNRPLVVLANLSGFDGSPESMRRLQLEYGAEIGRAVVNFQGPIVFCVVSRYHGGAFVVFSKALREDMEVVAVEGARASVIGGAPAAAVVFAREVETRTRQDPRVVEAEKAAASGGAARARLAEVVAAVRSEKLGEVGEEFDRIHSVERALKVGSLDRIIAARDLRPYLVDAVERGIARFGGAPKRP